MGANLTVLDDPTTFFQSYVLNRSNPTTFYNEYVAAFTLVDGDPVFIPGAGLFPQIQARAWYSNEVGL